MKRIRISPLQLIPISFLIVIIIGTALLLVPQATAIGESTDFVTALFTATTSTCVTGLVVVDTFSHWSVLGQVIILFLAQIGGLGVVAVGSMIMLIARKKFTLGDRILLGDSLNIDKTRGLLLILVRIFKGVFFVEAVGAALFTIEFIPRFGVAKGIWVSIFQSVSAFCNAGMDIIGADSLIGYNSSGFIMGLTMALIILGGLGFVVWFDILDGIKNGIKERYGVGTILSHLSEHSKLVLWMTFILIFGGAALIFLAEYDNPSTIGNMPLVDKILNSIFQSVTFRTAGFASVSQKGLTETTCVLGIILMFIGGSPVGTAGGIKTVTAFLFFMNAFSYVRKEKENVIFNRSVSHELMRKASAIVFISMSAVFIMTLLLMSCTGIALTDASYETISAIGTVGLSRNLTPTLDAGGRIIIIIAMYLGRIGPISMALFFTKAGKSEKKILHSEGTFYVG